MAPSSSRPRKQKAPPDLQPPLATLRELHGLVEEDRFSSVEELVQSVFLDADNEEETARAATLRLRKAFVDWNEARVARRGQLARVIEPLEGSDDLAKQISELLGRVFDRTGKVDLSHLREMKVSEARRALMEIEPVPRAICDRILMLEVPDANIPFSTEAMTKAKDLALIPKTGNRQHLNKIVSEHLNREDAIALYYLLEHHVAEGCTKTKCPLCQKK